MEDYSLNNIRVEHARLFKVMGNSILGEKWRGHINLCPDPFAFCVWLRG